MLNKVNDGMMRNQAWMDRCRNSRGATLICALIMGLLALTTGSGLGDESGADKSIHASPLQF